MALARASVVAALLAAQTTCAWAAASWPELEVAPAAAAEGRQLYGPVGGRRQVVDKSHQPPGQEKFVIMCFALAFFVFVVFRFAFSKRLPALVSVKQRPSREELEKILPVTYVDTEPTCAICLDTVMPDDACRQLPCGHAYHAACIVEWFAHEPRQGALQCPTCRQECVPPAPASSAQIAARRCQSSQSLARENAVGNSGPAPASGPARLLAQGHVEARERTGEDAV